MATPKNPEERQRVLNIIAANLVRLRKINFPGRGGRKQIADALEMRPQQWAPWEKALRMPNDESLERIAEFFEIAVDDLRTENSEAVQNANVRYKLNGNGGTTGTVVRASEKPSASADIEDGADGDADDHPMTKKPVKTVQLKISKSQAAKIKAREQFIDALDLENFRAVIQLEISIVKIEY